MFIVVYQSVNDAPEYFGPFNTFKEASLWMKKDFTNQLDIYIKETNNTNVVCHSHEVDSYIDGYGTWNVSKLIQI